MFDMFTLKIKMKDQNWSAPKEKHNKTNKNRIKAKQKKNNKRIKAELKKNKNRKVKQK